MGIVFAICSLAFAGINDIVFKKYGQKKRPTGIFFILIGIIWASFFLALGAFRGTLTVSTETIITGVAAGFFSAVSNIILVEVMKKTGASVAATIYRLNLVFVALLAFFYLHEKINIFKIAGLIAAGAAIALFAIPDKSQKGSSPVFIPVLVLAAAAFLRACFGIVCKVASNYAVSNEVFLAVCGMCWFAAGAVYYLLLETDVRVEYSVFPYAGLSGLLICGIVFFLKLAVNAADASIAVTVSQFSFLVTAPVAFMFMKERLTVWKALGINASVLCIVLFAFAG